MKSLHRCRPWIGPLALAAAVAGCSAFSGGKPRLDSSAGMFDKAEVSYRVDAAKLSPAPAEGRLVSYQTETAAALPAGALAEVQINYPHPEKRAGYAQVTVRIIDGAGAAESGRWTQFWKSGLKWSSLGGPRDARETWVLDLPQNEVAAIINSLHNSGFFTAYEKPAEGPQVQTVLDGAKVTKTWHQVPQLDALIVRVRTQGRLLSSPQGDADKLFQGMPGPTPSSVLAYRRLQDDEGVAMVSDYDQGAFAPSAGFQVVRLPATDAAPIRR